MDRVGFPAEVHRCRLYTANNADGVIEHVAARFWESRDDRPWDDVGPYWHRIFRELAATAAGALR